MTPRASNDYRSSLEASGADGDRAVHAPSKAFEAGHAPVLESRLRSRHPVSAAAVALVASPFDRRVIAVGGVVFAVLMA